MSTAAVSIIRGLRARGIKVTLRDGQPNFSSLDSLTQDEKVALMKRGREIQAELKLEQITRDAREELRGTSARLAARKRARELPTVEDTEL